MSVYPIDLTNAAILEELAELINICEQTEPLLGRQISANDLPAIFTDATAFHQEGQVWRSDTGRADAVGYLRFFHVNAAMNADLRFYIHPRVWNTERADDMFNWAVKRVRTMVAEQGRQTSFYSDCLPESAWRAAVLESQGLQPMRYTYHMERDLHGSLPTFQLPTGYILRTLVVPNELPTWVDLFNRAYRGQWNAVPTTVDVQTDLRRDSRYQQQHDLVVVGPTGALVAFCLGFVLEHAGVRVGWVLELGSDPHVRGQGLGRALLSETLRRFQAADLTIARLTVDGANSSGAKRLYEGLGFEPFSSEVLYGRVFGVE
jgi:mycothiol synthase